jgi:hypothetical protein
MPVAEKKRMLERVNKLSNAVKMAREEANSIEIVNKAIAEALLEYIF